MASVPYAAFYCEENAWLLADSELLRGRDPHVVFVTNRRRQCPMFFQRAATVEGAPVVWDYHVFVIAREGRGWSVWDPDTTLECPVLLVHYLASTFPEMRRVALRPVFRVMNAQTYISNFSSDRRHMRNPAGEYSAPPPPWPAIVRDGIGSNLESFLSLDEPFVGDVLDLTSFSQRFATDDD